MLGLCRKGISKPLPLSSWLEFNPVVSGSDEDFVLYFDENYSWLGEEQT